MDGMATATVTDCQFTSNLAQGGNDCDLEQPRRHRRNRRWRRHRKLCLWRFYTSPGSASLIVSGSSFSNNQAIAGNDNQSAASPAKRSAAPLPATAY